MTYEEQEIKWTTKLIRKLMRKKGELEDLARAFMHLQEQNMTLEEMDKKFQKYNRQQIDILIHYHNWGMKPPDGMSLEHYVNILESIGCLHCGRIY